MKIKPVILCGGSGTRLWPESKNNLPKQFIDFGGWTLFQKTLKRIQNPIYEYPIISTNLSYLNLVRKYLSKYPRHLSRHLDMARSQRDDCGIPS